VPISDPGGPWSSWVVAASGVSFRSPLTTTGRVSPAQHPDDPQLRELIGELSMASPEFRTWWAEHDVATRNSGTKRYRHPVVGEMKIHFEAMRLADEDQLLFIYTVEPGTPSHDAMGLLATWAATQDAEAAHASTNVAVRRMSWNPYGPLALPLGAGL
jgi:hypothetical protein